MGKALAVTAANEFNASHGPSKLLSRSPVASWLFLLSSPSSVSSGLGAAVSGAWPQLFLSDFLSAFRVLSPQHAGGCALTLQRKKGPEALPGPAVGHVGRIAPLLPVAEQGHSAEQAAVSLC